MIEVTFRYMDEPKCAGLNKDGVQAARRARPGWQKAFELLRYELARIGAANVVVEAGYRPEQVRSDGWPYSGSKPAHTAVRVSFQRDGQSIAFLQDGFGGAQGVEYNVWLIGMTLQALRAVERYGCTKGGQQYTGWAQIPQGRSIAATEWATVEEAVRFLVKTSGLDTQHVPSSIKACADGSKVHLDEIYRSAAKRAHPDVGGSHDLMSKVNRARDFIAGAAA